jgi:hypothetical protein
MRKYCQHCGAALGEGARFCQDCGQAVIAEVPQEAPPVAPVRDSAQDLAQDSTGPRASFAARNRVPLIAGVGVLALAIVGGLWLGRETTGPSVATEAPVADETAAADTPKSLDYHVAVESDLRDAPSEDGSQVVGRIERGQAVRGTIVDGTQGGRWLKLDEGGAYVNLVNLSSAAPPRLAEIDGSDRVTTAPCSIRESEAAGSKEKAEIAAGSPVRIVGITGKGAVELALPGGGVGYAAKDACPTQPSSAKWAAANGLIEFEPSSCEFGPELAPYFEKAAALRPTTEDESAEEYIYPVNKTFRGLKVSYVVSGYEWHGVAFVDSPARVEAVFRKLGFRLDKDGSFAVSDDTPVSSSISATQEDKQMRGKSELICGI